MDMGTGIFIFTFVFSNLVLVVAGFMGVWDDVKLWRSGGKVMLESASTPQHVHVSWRSHDLPSVHG